ncbi:MAG: SURF1 family cytochrome oxidase biogenesis protein [Pseudolysinimonas sp.]|uniref:SURF1 family protein n=1 Tax=Pseudolysinimonas sp. TaxID=2680009 RepID=UPI003266354D
MSTTTSPSIAARFWAIARTPRWIAALLLCLAIAAGFAALGQWQLSRSIENAEVVDIDTETAVPLSDIAQPRAGITGAQFGRTVEVAGAFVPGDFVVLIGRNNGGADTGSWLVGHLLMDDGSSVAVALGWSAAGLPANPTLPDGTWVGRYLPSEDPQASDFEHGMLSSLSVADLVNRWSAFAPSIYSGYIVLEKAPAGLETITAVAPDREITLNLLNVFYAIEWALFASFAIYLWYRLVRDAVERTEVERDDADALVD